MDSSEKPYIRTIEDVHKIIHHAKLDAKTLAPVSQAIYFSGITNHYRLLELDNELLSKLKNGVELTLRGKKDDKAVLCSDSKTYEVKEAETSNSLLLIPNLKFPTDLDTSSSDERIVENKEVLGIFHTYLEVKPCKPKFQKLRKILESSSYRGSELESELLASGVPMYTTEDLLKEIQASHLELMNALNDLHAFQLDGNWRLLEFQYLHRVLFQFLDLIDEQSWKLDEIVVAEVFELLDGIVPPFVIQYLLSIYTEAPENASSDGQKVKLIEHRVCRVHGENILKSLADYELKDFLKLWQDGVPEGVIVNLHDLDGLFYMDVQKNEKNIHYCPEHQLPEEVGERIQHLFKLKPKWTFEDIKPYIQVFATEKVNENTILMKYARASTSNGVRLYSSKHGK